MNERHYQIINWLASLFPNECGYKLCPIVGDASSRDYYRLVVHNRPYVVMDSQFDSSLNQFIKIANLLIKYKIKAPKIIGINCELGLILISDLGQNLYLPAIEQADDKRLDVLYQDAIDSIVKMQLIPSNEIKTFTKMDKDYIKDKLEVFETWYLNKHLSLSTTFKDNLNALNEIFTDCFCNRPSTFVHLDYHSRNLMVLSENNPGVLDFQDAMLGPSSYDLVSLLQDAYFTLPKEKLFQYIEYYFTQAKYLDLLNNVSLQEFIDDFYMVAMQRHLKNLGVFARLNLKYGKSNYLQYMPRLLKYIFDIMKNYSKFDCLAEMIFKPEVADPQFVADNYTT